MRFFSGTYPVAAFLLYSALAQCAELELQQTRYELRAGNPVALAAPRETIDFLLNAKSRTVEIDGAPGGIVAAPNRARDQVLLATSARVRPGPHTVKLTAIGETGEERVTAFDVVVNALQTVPNNATRPPVVLLNGWETGYTGVCNIASASLDTFGNLAQYLVSDGVPIVYLFDNCAEDPNQTIETLGNDLNIFLNAIQYANGTQVQQIDLVAHSMGGLIARSYLAGLQPQAGLLLEPPANTLVRKMVLIATPNFGSFIAGTFAANIAPGTQSAELVPGSSFLWNLGTWNQFSDDLRGVNAISVVGNAGIYSATVANASDGLVTMTSASVGFVSQTMSTTRIVPYCHVDPVVFINTSLGSFECNAPGIANVTDTNQLTGQIVRSFLSDTTAWQSIGTSPSKDPYLSVDGGVLFGVLKANGTYVSDISQVVWGNVTLSSGGDTGTIFYDDMVYGTSTYVATSQSVGTITCAASKGPVGWIDVTRCKIDATISSVTPAATGTGKVVAAGTALTINGVTFGTSKCASCSVTATLASGTSGPQTLTVSSWSNTAITVQLPASLTGFVTLTVNTSIQGIGSSDSINVLAISPGPQITTSPSTLQFSYTSGAADPRAQSVQITNGGGGSLQWTATSNQSWLVVTPASGTAPSAAAVSVSPEGMSAGTYSGTVQIAASGASNTPVTVAVTLTVTAAPAALVIAPQALTFQYTLGGTVPAAQNVAISNAGSGTLTWSASDSDTWIGLAPATGAAPGSVAISVNPANMAAGSYTSTVQITSPGATGSPASVAVTLVVQAASTGVSITAVLNGGSFVPGIAAATWVSIFGTNLAPTPYSWQSSDFVNGLLPTSLQGVSVTIDGLAAYVAFVSPTQINVLAPDDTTVGPVQVQVTNGGQQSNIFTAQEAQFAPAFFTFNASPYVAALHADYSLVGSPNLIPGVASTPAAPGEVIQIFGTGFGPANPAVPTGQLVTTPSVLANQVQFSVGGVAATVQFAGLVESGLYQFNVTVPALPNGDAAIAATVGGVQTQTGALITVGQ